MPTSDKRLRNASEQAHYKHMSNMLVTIILLRRTYVKFTKASHASTSQKKGLEDHARVFFQAWTSLRYTFSACSIPSKPAGAGSGCEAAVA